jgi:hypothetical protein
LEGADDLAGFPPGALRQIGATLFADFGRCWIAGAAKGALNIRPALRALELGLVLQQLSLRRRLKFNIFRLRGPATGAGSLRARVARFAARARPFQFNVA